MLDHCGVVASLGCCRDASVPPGYPAAVAREARTILAGRAALAAGSVDLGSDLLFRPWVVPARLGHRRFAAKPARAWG